MIYLDNNATTALDSEVLYIMKQFWSAGPANASSQHTSGQRAKASLEDACDEILQSLAASKHRALITSGGTEANNWIVGSLGEGDGAFVTSSVEHPSILEAAENLLASGQPVQYLPVDSSGVINLAALKYLLGDNPKPRAVSVMAANNETGVLQPIDEIATCCNDAGVPFHTDASQIVGKLPFQIDALPITAVTVSPHKFHGPTGIGALILRKGSAIRPLLKGGAQQLGYRAGTEPVALVKGMAAAISIAVKKIDRMDSLAGRWQKLERSLLEQIPGFVIHGVQVDRIPQTTCFSIPNTDRQALLMRLDFDGIACSTGSACASGSSEPSHVLQAMGMPDDVVNSGIRLSGTYTNSEDDIDQAISRIINCCNKLATD